MRTMQKKITTEKENGRFYTPKFIVESILDLSGYKEGNVSRKHVIDNSCGDGAFLCEIVDRYCENAVNFGLDKDALRDELSTYIHGIELEAIEHEKCLRNVTSVAEKYGITGVKWDIVCGNSLTTTDYDGRMDFVLGNPPYVRVHNLGEASDDIKNYSFAQNGMTDLFIVFYELGIKMLSRGGILGYITPSSYFNSIAGAYMRKYIAQENLLKAVVDLKHFQAFAATTYTAITVLEKGKTDGNVEYYGFDPTDLKPYYIETVSPAEYQIAGNYYFAKKAELQVLQKILFNHGRCDVAVKNGYATLCDDVFIHDFEFESEFIIPVIKSSKGTRKKIFYPYDKSGKLVAETVLRQDAELYRYLLSNKDRLVKRSNERDREAYWYAFGRSQAILDTFKHKLAINSLIRKKGDFKFVEAPAGTGVYGGLYIISDTTPMKDVIAALETDEFVSYVRLLAKYKSGGYYTFSSKDVKAYLDYKFSYDGGLLC